MPDDIVARFRVREMFWGILSGLIAGFCLALGVLARVEMFCR